MYSYAQRWNGHYWNHSDNCWKHIKIELNRIRAYKKPLPFRYLLQSTGIFPPTRIIMRGILLFALACACSSSQIKVASSASDECTLTPVIHVLQYPGCVPKPIPSFACIGRCGSYVQVSRINN